MSLRVFCFSLLECFLCEKARLVCWESFLPSVNKRTSGQGISALKGEKWSGLLPVHFSKQITRPRYNKIDRCFDCKINCRTFLNQSPFNGLNARTNMNTHFFFLHLSNESGKLPADTTRCWKSAAIIPSANKLRYRLPWRWCGLIPLADPIIHSGRRIPCHREFEYPSCLNT